MSRFVAFVGTAFKRAKKIFVRPVSSEEKLRLALQSNAQKKEAATGDYYRQERAFSIREGRIWDRQRLWRVSFNNNLQATNTGLGVELADLVRKHARGGKVFEIGCGSGLTISQLQKAVPDAHYSASGLVRVPEWKEHSNSAKIEWHICDAGGLREIIPKASCDIIFSSLGIPPSSTDLLLNYLSQVRNSLKKGGLFIFNYQREVLPEHIEQVGFNVLSKKEVLVPFSESKGEPKTHVPFEFVPKDSTNVIMSNNPRNHATAFVLQKT